MGEARGFDLDRRTVTIDALPDGDPGVAIEYDTLIVAGGARYSYFGHDEWQESAFEVKSLESALAVRRRIFTAFEAAELEQDPERRAAWLTFVVVGGGPTGVEMAGQIAELARDTLPGDFHAIDSRHARILLVEASERILPAFPARLSAKATEALARLGVTLVPHTAVVDLDERSVSTRGAEGTIVRVSTRTIVWAAGVIASELAGALAGASGTETDRQGRVPAGVDLTIHGHPEVIALGDMAAVHDDTGNGGLLPGLASVAMQQGRYAARAVQARVRGERPEPPERFRYVDKGNLATIGRASAVADIRGIQISGALAWLTWAGVHIFYLIGFQNRLLVITRWVFSFVTRGRGARLITGPADAAASKDAPSPVNDRKKVAVGHAREAPIWEAQMSEDQGSDSEGDAGTARSFDPERGAFDPPRHPPLRDRETNPRGVRHIDETAQDHTTVADRPRYQAAQGRRSRMIAAATKALQRVANRRSAPSRSAPDDPKAS